MSDVVVVVESRHHGGSRHTVDAAVARGIPVGAVPGSIRSPTSEGTNALLAEGAFPVCSAGDILVALSLAGASVPAGVPTPGPAARTGRRARSPPRASDRRVYEALSPDPASLDDLARAARLDLGALVRRPPATRPGRAGPGRRGMVGACLRPVQALEGRGHTVGWWLQARVASVASRRQGRRCKHVQRVPRRAEETGMETVEHDETVIGRYLASIEGGAMAETDALGDGVVLDATVPNWRFTVRGADAVRAELARWYADPGTFEDLTRTPVPGGELVTFTLRWEENGIPHAVHQAHVLSVGAQRDRARPGVVRRALAGRPPGRDGRCRRWLSGAPTWPASSPGPRAARPGSPTTPSREPASNASASMGSSSSSSTRTRGTTGSCGRPATRAAPTCACGRAASSVVCPPVIDHAVVAAAFDGTVGMILLRDVGDALLQPDAPFTPEQHARFLDHMAALHAAFWGWRDDVGLTPLDRRYLLFSPGVAAAEAASGSTAAVPRFMADGWRRLPDVSPAMADCVLPLLADPAPARRRAGAPAAHAGPRGLEGSQPGQPPRRAHGAARLRRGTGRGFARWRICPGTWRSMRRCCPSPRTTCSRRIETALAGHGVDTTDWWDDAVALELLGCMLQFGWEKALGGPGDELWWWEDRVAARRSGCLDS